MNTEKVIMDQIRCCAKEFVEREYPDEAPYFDIAWEIFKEALNDTKKSGPNRGLTIADLKRPTVRDMKRAPINLGENGTIMAPRVIRAFHILFTMKWRMRPENGESLKQEILQLLSQKKFSPELSMKIVDFFMENRDDW